MTQPLTAGSLAGLSHRHVHSGKVRELFSVGDDMLLLVASDRISAFDWVLPTEIPDKGAILTALTLWWFEQLADIVPTHLVTASVDDYPAELAPHAEALRGRSMLCRRLDMVPVECVARGFLTGGG
ncbi:MAG TPA: phosphoribosylaminoimidazolesuccinocarboxamide synthase, partial [Mycobacteriales bacterium]|nr:phosphoribosylaminoimidazolesuccinocarboxamide synthase [Mycobacteriales bacterium]